MCREPRDNSLMSFHLRIYTRSCFPSLITFGFFLSSYLATFNDSFICSFCIKCTFLPEMFCTWGGATYISPSVCAYLFSPVALTLAVFLFSVLLGTVT